MKTKAAFAAKMQVAVIISMIVSFVVIIERITIALHKTGLVLLIA